MECCRVRGTSHIKNILVRNASKINCDIQAACARAHNSAHAAQLDPQAGNSLGRTAGEAVRGGAAIFSATRSSCDCASRSHPGPHKGMAASVVNTEVFNFRNLVLLGISPS